jgi:hypothetical protein
MLLVAQAMQGVGNLGLERHRLPPDTLYGILWLAQQALR